MSKRSRSYSGDYALTTQPSMSTISRRSFTTRPGRSYKARIRSSRYRLQDAVNTVAMSTQQEIDINELLGFNSAGFDAVFVVTQNSVGLSLSGAPYIFGLNFQNASALANVYDEYRIVSCNQRIFFSQNSTPINNIGTALMYGVVDYTDGNPLAGPTAALAYANHKIMNLFNTKENGEFKMIGGKLGVQYSVDSTLPSGVRTLGATKRAPWMRTAVTDVEHNGFKYWLDPFGGSDRTIGKLMFITDVIVQYRQLK